VPLPLSLPRQSLFVGVYSQTSDRNGNSEKRDKRWIRGPDGAASAFILAGATAAIAAETVSLFLIGIDEQPLEGKVIGTVSTTMKSLGPRLCH
jgi:hypothetical protein